MGFLKKLFGRGKEGVESGVFTSNNYADELSQIQEFYEQGFLSKEEYDFQIGLYKKWSKTAISNSGLNIVEKGTFSDEDLYRISIRVGQYISSLFTVNDEFDPDFYWLKYAATRPFFHHLCFSYKKTVYSCMIGVVMEDREIWLGQRDSENFYRESLGKCLYPCIIPVTQSGEIYDEEKVVLDAKTLQPINFVEQEDFVSPVMSNYELYTRAINEVAIYLTERGCKNISSCDIIAITPSIWFTDENGCHSYILIRSLPAGLDKASYDFNKGMIEYYKDAKGYFVNLLWNNLRGNNGDFRDTRIIKNGSYVHNKIELEPIEDIIVNHPHFNFVDKEMYNV